MESNNLADWLDTWQLRFNASEYKVLHIGSTYGNCVYTMETGCGNITAIEVTDLQQDLGIYVNPQLKFSKHVEIMVKKANSKHFNKFFL